MFQSRKRKQEFPFCPCPMSTVHAFLRFFLVSTEQQVLIAKTPKGLPFIILLFIAASLICRCCLEASAKNLKNLQGQILSRLNLLLSSITMLFSSTGPATIHCSSQRFRHNCSMRTSRSRIFFHRKCIQKIIVALFMIYVVLCLHQLKNERIHIQLVLKSEDAILLPESSRNLQNPRRFTREISSDIHASQRVPNRGGSTEDGAIVDKTNEPSEPGYISNQKNDLQRSSLDDVHISVKTSKKFHHQRLDIILRTWFNEAKEQVKTYFQISY